MSLADRQALRDRVHGSTLTAAFNPAQARDAHGRWIEMGALVKFKYQSHEVSGKVQKFSQDGSATFVKVTSPGRDHGQLLAPRTSELTVVDAVATLDAPSAPDVKPDKPAGKAVTFKYKGKELSGTVEKTSQDGSATFVRVTSEGRDKGQLLAPLTTDVKPDTSVDTPALSPMMAKRKQNQIDGIGVDGTDTVHSGRSGKPLTSADLNRSLTNGTGTGNMTYDQLFQIASGDFKGDLDKAATAINSGTLKMPKNVPWSGRMPSAQNALPTSQPAVPAAPAKNAQGRPTGITTSTPDSVANAVKNGWGLGDLSTVDLKAAVEKDGAEKVAAGLNERRKAKAAAKPQTASGSPGNS